MQASIVLKRFLSGLVLVWLMVSAVYLLSRLLPGTFGEERVLQATEGFYSQGGQQSRQAAYLHLLKRTRQDLPLFYFSIPAPDTSAAATANYKYLIPALHWNGTQNQYHYWAKNLLAGNLGQSFINSKPVLSVIWQATATTLPLLLVSMTVTIAIAFGAGIWLVRDTSVQYRKPLLASLVALDSIPLFVLCLLLLLLLANPDAWQLFPVFGLGLNLAGNKNSWLSHLPYLVLPIVCLTLNHLPYLTNQFYNALAGTMQSGYIRTARSKGLSEQQVITKHALKNALLPVITTISETLPALLAGTIVIETIFAIPGLGRLLVSSVLARDFPVVIGVMLLVAFVKMLSNVAADVAYSLADPRIGKRIA